MSTYLSRTQTCICSEDELVEYFIRSAKPADRVRVGLECEILGVDKTTGKAMPYEGPNGIGSVLARLSQGCGYERIIENGKVIALRNADSVVGLEPGGQIELSAAPVTSIFEVKEQIDRFADQLRKVREFFPATEWLACGIQPVSTAQEIEMVPKERYALMGRHFSSRGPLSYHMMKLTASNQVNLDYSGEEDAMSGLRTVLGITSIVTAIFANSAFSEGRPNGYMSRRLDIWNHTDHERTGLMVEFTRPDRMFRDYLDYVMGVPVIFVVREGKWFSAGGMTFRDYFERGFHGQRPTLEDFELHLSTLFPEARLKSYLEIRGADGQPVSEIPAVAAFWKGILYHPGARKEAWDLVAFASESERLDLHHKVPRLGLRARLAGKPILPIAQALAELACGALRDLNGAAGRRDESVFLEEVCSRLKRRERNPAEILLSRWESEFEKKPNRLIEYLSIG